MLFASSAKHRHYEKMLKSSGKCFIYGKLVRHTNKVSLRFSYVTHYMKHSLLGTWRVISSIITRNFFMTRSKQPMTIGTNRMCISRDDIAPTPCAFHDSSRQLQENCFRCFDVCDTGCPIGKLPFQFLTL